MEFSMKMRLFLNNEHQSRLILFLYSIAIIFTFIAIDRLFFTNNIKEAILGNGYAKILERERILKSFVSESEITLNSLRNNELFKHYLNNPNNNDIEQLKKQFLLVAQMNSNFMQLRYLDKHGNEVIRIDRISELTDPFVQSQLQNKKDRYYFSNSRVLPFEKIWFSPLDLNIENGALEVPYKPTIRAIMPISSNGEFDGILVINYFMNDFLKQLVDSPLYKTILVDFSGNILLHYEEEKSWGLYKEQKYNISSEFEDYKEILSHSIYKSNDLISKQLDSPIANKPILILEPKEEYLTKEITNHYFQYAYTILIVLVLTFIASIFVSKLLRNLLEDLKNTKKLNDKLKDLYERFFTILNTTNDAIIVVNENKNVEFLNKAATNITGYQEGELLNKPIELFVKDQVLFFDMFEKVFNKNMIKTFENTCFTKDEKKVIVLTTLIKIKKQNNILFIGRDITELKKKEIELKEKEEIILQQSKIATMGEMLENIAHQWRQPLSIISTSASGLQLRQEMNSLDEEIISEGLENIVKTTNYLSQTIEDFRNFFSTSKVLELFEISAMIEKTLYLMTSKLTSTQVSIEMTKEKMFYIKGVKNEMIQCFMNIFSNAIDEFERKEQEPPRLLMISIYEENQKIIIETLDNAGGIPEEALTKVFNAHFTTKGESGTGIGLYMTKKIIEKSFGGEIAVENKEFTFEKNTFIGASFKISLPMA